MQTLQEPVTAAPVTETQEPSRHNPFADYDDLSRAVEQAYDEIADDADAMFDRVGTQTDTVRNSRIDVELHEDGARAVYRTEQEQGSQTTAYRHVPAGDWDEFAQEVYAPLAAFQAVMDDEAIEAFATAYGLSADADMYEWADAVRDAAPQTPQFDDPVYSADDFASADSYTAAD